GSALTSLVAPLRLVDDVDTAFPPDHAVLAMARAQRFERVLDFHVTSVALGPKATQVLCQSEMDALAGFAPPTMRCGRRTTKPCLPSRDDRLWHAIGPASSALAPSPIDALGKRLHQIIGGGATSGQDHHLGRHPGSG